MLGKQQTYDIGDLVTVTNMITSLAGQPADPSALTVRVLRPDGTELGPIVYPNVLLDNPAVGTWVLTMPIAFDQSGVWRVRWEGTGSLVMADEIRLPVRGTRFAV